MTGRRRGRKSKAEQELYEQELKQAFDLHETGVSISEVSRRFGYADSAALAIAWRRRGMEPQMFFRRFWTPERVQFVREQRAKGAMAAEIGKVLEVSADSVRAICHREGIEWERRYSHGSSAGYGYRKCRCDECRAWNTRRTQEDKKRKRGTPPRTHGSSGYLFHGCRCDICSGWCRDRNRRAAERRKQRQAS